MTTRNPAIRRHSTSPNPVVPPFVFPRGFYSRSLIFQWRTGITCLCRPWALPLWLSALPGPAFSRRGQRPGRPAISLPMRDRETGPPPAGRMRRPHKDAHNHRGGGAQREVDSRQLRHLSHTRFRVSLGLHGVLALGDTDYILTRKKRFGNTDYPAQRHG